MDVFLAQLLGLYFIIAGVIVLVRGKSLLSTIGAIVKDRSLMVIIGAVELAAGIGIVLAYPAVSLSALGLVSLVGYSLVIEGVLYLAGNTLMQQVVRQFSTKKWYIAGGILAIAMGAYMADYGFALGYF
jgi:uncharacterized membrane protein HdeD (DUF308 family)